MLSGGGGHRQVWDGADGCDDPRACACVRDQWIAARLEVEEGRARAAGVSGFGFACMRCTTDVSSSSSDTSATVPPEVNVLGGGFSVGASIHAGGAKTARLMREWGAVPFAEDPSPATATGATAAVAVAVRAAARRRSAVGVALRWVVEQGGAVAVTPGLRPRSGSKVFETDTEVTAMKMKGGENGERKNSPADVVAEAVEAVQGDWALTHEEMRELGQAPFGTHHGHGGAVTAKP